MTGTELAAVGDAEHYTLGDTLDLAIILRSDTAGTVPVSDGVSVNYDAASLWQGATLGTDYDYDNPATNKVRFEALQTGNYKVRVV
jgi:hypothetical protein